MLNSGNYEGFNKKEQRQYELYLFTAWLRKTKGCGNFRYPETEIFHFLRVSPINCCYT